MKIMNNMAIFRKKKFAHCKSVYYYTLGFMYKQIYGTIPYYSDFADYLMRVESKQIVPEILDELNPTYRLLS